MFVIYFLLAVISYVLTYKKYQDSLHPIAIITSVWFITASVSSLKWGYFQTTWLVKTHFMIVLSGCMCLVFGLFIVKKHNNLIKIKEINYLIEISENIIDKNYIIIIRIVFVCSLIVVMNFFLKRGMNINYFANLKGNDVKSEISEGIAGISSFDSYFLNFFPFNSIYSFFELIYAKKRSKLMIVYNILVIFVCIFYCIRIIFSRGSFLYLFLGYLYIFNSKYKIKLKYLMSIMIGVITVLGVIMMNRLFEGSVVFSNVNHINNPILASSYNYIAYCFDNFDRIVFDGSRWKITANVFQSFYKLFGIYSSNQVVKHEIGFFNAITWLSPFYDDLGLIGVVIYPSLISYFLAVQYNKSAKNKYSVLLLAVLQKAIFTTFFGNYFLTSLSIMFPYFVTILICTVVRKNLIGKCILGIKKSLIKD